MDYLGITTYRQWLQTAENVTVSQINNGTLSFDHLFTSERIAYLQSMASKGVKIIGAVLSPPACLKKNNCLCQKWSGTCCGSPCGTYNCVDDDNYMLPEYYDEYARYLAFYAREFKKKVGVGLYAISIQNEPLFNEPYPSCKLFSFEYGKVLKAVHDTFAKYPEISSIKFYGPEHMCNYSGNNGGNGAGSNYLKALLDTATYRPYLDAYAVHGYSDGIAADLGTSTEWEAFANKVVVQYGKEMWMSETSSPDLNEWSKAYWYMKCMFMSFKSGRLSLYSYNSLEWLCSNGYATRQLYNHMHFYRFIRPGYKMIKVTDTDPDVETIGFKSGSSVTMIVINLVKNKKTIQFSDFPGKPSFFHVYQSTSMDMCAYAGKVTNNTFELPGESVVTITYDASNPDAFYGPTAPQNLKATNITDNSITVTWSVVQPWKLNGSNVNITGYVVYLNGVKKTFTPITGTSYTFTGLKPGTTYTIEVYARDAMINQSVASTIQVTTTCEQGGCTPITAVNDAQENLFTVVPNPVSNGYVWLNLPDAGVYDIVVVDMTGRTVLRKSGVAAGQRMDVESLNDGIYLVIAQKDQARYLTRMMIR